MSRFLVGFLTASLLWGLGAFLYFGGVLVVGSHDPKAAAAPITDAAPDNAPDPASHHAHRRHRWHGHRRASGTWASRDDAPTPQGNATTGDNLGTEGTRTLDMGSAGGEQQLSGSQIEQGFDGVFAHVRRCLVLAAGDQALHGRVTFGLRIESSGHVSKINLSGPAAVTTGDCGNCLRSTARSIHFPSFDGPTMVVHYPITLD